MKKKYYNLFAAIVTLFTMTGNSSAQSLKDLFTKENISKVVSAVAGTTQSIDMTGTWTYNGPAVEFESENLLMQAGGVAASTALEEKINEQLTKFGISKGELTFTFNADSTFTSSIGKQPLQGTYSYDASTQQVKLSCMKIINVSAKVTYVSDTMSLLFNADKLLQLITGLASKIDNSTLQTVTTLASNYDGMLIGLEMKKQQ